MDGKGLIKGVKRRCVHTETKGRKDGKEKGKGNLMNKLVYHVGGKGEEKRELVKELVYNDSRKERRKEGAKQAWRRVSGMNGWNGKSG